MTQMIRDVIGRLGDASTPGNGAALVAHAAYYVDAINNVNVTGLQDGAAIIAKGRNAVGDGGGGVFRYSAASAQTTDGGTVFAPAAGSGRLFRDGWTVLGFNGAADARWFGLVGGVFDTATQNANNTALSLAAAWLALNANSASLEFSSGTYGYNVSPNWNINNAQIVAKGEVRLRNYGTGNSVIIDGGATTGGVYNLRFGKDNPFIIEGGAGSANGVYCRAILQGCDLGFTVVGAGTTYAGMRVEFAVCARIKLTVSSNVNGYAWYSRPNVGLYLTNRGGSELSSWVTFDTAILEGCAANCCYIDQAFGCNFFGGTIEGSGSVGVNLTANAFQISFYGVDFESNTDHDVYCLGRNNHFVNCSTNKVVTFDGTAHNNLVLGGSHQSFNHTASTFGNRLLHLTYNKNGSGSITDTPNKNIQEGLTNFQTNDIERRPAATVGITVSGTSTFTYTNNGFQTEWVGTFGATVTALSLTHGGTATSGLAVATFVPVAPGSSITATWTGGSGSAPTMQKLVGV